MTRISSVALALFLCLVNSPLNMASSPLQLIDANGSLTRASVSQSSLGNGIVAVLSSPGTKSFFADSDDGVTLSSSGGVSILSSPGATLSGTTSLTKGNGAAAASTVAGSIIITGITESDLEYGLDDTRHGHTLTGIFRAKIQSSSATKTKLILAVPSDDVDQDKIMQDVKTVFKTANAEIGGDASFDDLYEVVVEKVSSAADAEKVMKIASEAASQVTVQANIQSTIADVYTHLSSASEASPSATAAVLACDDSFAKQHKAARAKISAWKARTSRGLYLDNFGTAASQLLKRTMELFDRDTISAAGIPGHVASYRMEVREKLQGRIESSIRELFDVQVENLEKSTLKKFNALLLRKHGKDKEGTESFYNENAAAVRSAAFSFETAMDDLEVPSLSLTKTKASKEIANKLNTALLTFSDSPMARLKDMKKVSRTVSKQKKPSERSVDIALDFVAMIRPDGFGNFQGFGGYQFGGNQIIVGVHNDADAPDVISQFGGKRPPFLRVQPKLKVDVEL